MHEDDDNVIEFKRPEKVRPQPQSGPAAFNLPPFTKVIIVVLAGLFALDWLTEQFLGYPLLTAYFALYGLGTDALALIRLVTYSFVHADLGHLAMNVVGLAVLGKVLEPVLGPIKMVAVLAMGSAAGAVLEILLSGNAILIGISAGVGALYGVALLPAIKGFFGRLDQAVIILTLLFVVTSLFGLLTGFMGNIAHGAHLGGFALGLAMSRLLIPVR